MRDFGRNEDGASAIEAAICFPLIIMVFWACFEYALFFMNAARINQQMDTVARSAALLENPSEENITALIRGELGQALTDRMSIEVAREAKYDYEFATVAMSYNYSLRGPFIDQITVTKNYRNQFMLPQLTREGGAIRPKSSTQQTTQN